MLTLSEDALVKAIEHEELFEATLVDGSLQVCIREYVPYVCTAIHAGHQMSKEKLAKCSLDEAQRFQEEDPYTDKLIESFPITLIATNSRYEYDLNRSPGNCIYEVAWDQQVWNSPLSEQEIADSKSLHDKYYRILKTLLKVLEKKFGACLLLDLHSYNWQLRSYKEAPEFNIGTFNINTDRWAVPLKTFEHQLSKIELANIDVNVKRDCVFEGKGYQVEFIKNHFSNTLAIPLEIKKFFMDERNGEVFPLVLDQLAKSLYLSVLETATVFSNGLKNARLKRKDLQTSNIEPVVLAVDKALYQLAKGVETLHYVNPINIQQEKKRFFSKRGYNPQFKYRQLRVDPYEFKEKLYKLPVSQIQDPLVKSLYRNVVDSFATKIELLTKVGTPHFLYNSLRYYGEPTSNDINNALFLLHALDLPKDEQQLNFVSAEQAKLLFEASAERYQLDCKVQLSNRLVAKAMVDNNKRLLLINRNAKLSEFDINALIHHELGVHMVTTMNALEQPLKVFRLGLPGNTYTQEGIAILSEYVSGNLNLTRLKQLSLRVLAVEMLVKGKEFHQTYTRLRTDFSVSEDEAFSLTTRVYRGGGFTKDFLYLSGFRDLVKLFGQRDITPLLIGKTDTHSLPTLDAMIERGILQQPKYISPAFTQAKGKDNPVLDYLVQSIR